MLNGDDNENGFKTNRSNQQKNKLHVQNTFSSNYQKTNSHVQHAFLSFLCTTTTLFCTTKTSNFLVTHYFYGGIVVCVYPIFCFLCSCSLLFFTAAHFHLAGRQQFLIFSTPLSISMFFSLPKGGRYLLKTSRRAAGGIKVVDYPRNVKFSPSSYTFFVIGV